MAGKKTSTSSFGSPGRSGHDASTFYAGNLYKGLFTERNVKYNENPIPEEFLDKVICASAEDMKELPADCIHLVVTSPPYNVGKVYDQDQTLEDYLSFLEDIWREVKRVLVPGGRLCINVANLGRKPYIPIHALIIPGLLRCGFLMRGEIIWNKGSSAGSSTAWGSWRSASNSSLRDIHEYILVFSKDTFQRKNPNKREDTISRDEFLEATRSVWDLPTVSARRIGHPAPFPEELPRRLIELYTFKDEVILDPFMGSGQTALAAIKSDRHFVGYEIETEYVDLALKRIQQLRMKRKNQEKIK
ncbi:MAG TPA: site-specific DNA-methyltransferase [Anaerolineales bacterium]|nr:site-specific DNA-methyltransferase [Anaerolineales bacterium]